MANYETVIKSNNFKIEEEKKDIITQVLEILDLDTSIYRNDSKTIVSFGSYQDIPSLDIDSLDSDILNELNKHKLLEDIDAAEDTLYGILQYALHPDSNAIITTVGHEKLRYVDGFATIITKKQISYTSLAQIADEKLADMDGFKKLATMNKEARFYFNQKDNYDNFAHMIRDIQTSINAAKAMLKYNYDKNDALSYRQGIIEIAEMEHLIEILRIEKEI